MLFRQKGITSLAAALALTLALILTVHAADPATLHYSHSANAGPLNPHLYSPNQMYAQAMVYEPLVRYGRDGKILPWLAESWEVSLDGKEYLFSLRKGVLFSDGTPFDAAAVKKNFDAVLNNAKRHSWLELVNQIREVTVEGSHSVRLVLKNPYYPILQELALIRPLRFLSPAAFPENGNTAEGIKEPVGTGPWVLRESKLGEFDLFVRNEKYWGEKPSLERIIVKVIPDPNMRAVAFETGDIDLIYGDGQINADVFDRFRKDGRLTTHGTPPLSSRVIALNSNRGPTKELAVRKAVLHAVNRPAILKSIFLDTEVKADSLFSPDLPYCDLHLAAFAHDPSRAKQILEEAGWKAEQESGIRAKEGRPLEIDLCFEGNNAVQKSIVEAIQSDLKAVGIQANLIGEEVDSFQKRQKSGEFGMIFGDTWGPPYDPHSFVASMRSPSHADYQAQVGLPMKAELDANITEVLISTDESKRRDLYRSILTTLHDQAVYLPLSYQSGMIVHRNELKSVSAGPTKYEIPFESITK